MSDPTGLLVPLLIGGLLLGGATAWMHDCTCCLTKSRDSAHKQTCHHYGREDGCFIPDNTEINAVKHCVASCLAVRKCGLVCARLLDIRDHGAILLGNPVVANLNDLINNGVGRGLAGGTGSCLDLCVGAKSRLKWGSGWIVLPILQPILHPTLLPIIKRIARWML